MMLSTTTIVGIIQHFYWLSQPGAPGLSRLGDWMFPGLEGPRLARPCWEAVPVLMINRGHQSPELSTCHFPDAFKSYKNQMLSNTIFV